jgi:hypothetical protein
MAWAKILEWIRSWPLSPFSLSYQFNQGCCTVPAPLSHCQHAYRTSQTSPNPSLSISLAMITDGMLQTLGSISA